MVCSPRCWIISIVLFQSSHLYITRSFTLSINAGFEYYLMISNAYPEFQNIKIRQLLLFSLVGLEVTPASDLCEPGSLEVIPGSSSDSLCSLVQLLNLISTRLQIKGSKLSIPCKKVGQTAQGNFCDILEMQNVKGMLRLFFCNQLYQCRKETCSLLR